MNENLKKILYKVIMYVGGNVHVFVKAFVNSRHFEDLIFILNV